MRKLIFYLSILFVTVSCAGFKNVDPIRLDKKSVENISGTYKNVPVTKSGFYVQTLTDVFDRNTNMFNWKEKYDKKDVIVKLKMIKKNRLHVEIFESENILFSKDLKVKLKNDGFLYLKERRFMIDGIPLVFGGWNFQKSRFAIDSNNNLKVQSNYFYCNGILILMSDWKTLHHDLIFEEQ
ncbi:hypothetical protein [Chryseobacterium luquanense]|uniref:Lipoprotein n=1 Tax=Chryseobacterium luquanense TaxID=2983766 RepID=A0ABT3Y4V6_9FLAO|nr:hypothetical protein [Chryseobacterium luquanense]MCX8533180.1 hypothetical protein [Chryseobacterium luquanense]